MRSPPRYCRRELVGVDACLPEEGAQGAFGHVARVVGDGGVAIVGGVEPDLVRTGSLTIEGEAQRPQALHDVAIAEPGEASLVQPSSSG